MSRRRYGPRPRRRYGVPRRRFLGTVGAGLAALGGAGSARASPTVETGPLNAPPSGIPPVLSSAIDVDTENLTATLPLYRGQGPDGGDVYYVLTEASNLRAAHRFGLNWAPKLGNAVGTRAVQMAEPGSSGRFNPFRSRLRFAGTVDFSGERNVVPGSEGFPPDTAEPGATGDDAYSPFVATPGEGVVYNAPHVANDTGEHDHLVSMDTDEMTATLDLVAGFYEDRDVFYLTTDAYPADISALEGATFAPTLATAPAAGDRDLESSARESIFVVVNGPDGQGLQSALTGRGGPRNVTRSEQVCHDPRDPTACSLFYSPLWDVHPVAWTDSAVENGERRILTDHEDIIDLVVEGDLLSSAATDGPVNTLLGNVRALGAAVDCPIIAVEPESEGE